MGSRQRKGKAGQIGEARSRWSELSRGSADPGIAIKAHIFHHFLTWLSLKKMIRSKPHAKSLAKFGPPSVRREVPARAIATAGTGAFDCGAVRVEGGKKAVVSRANWCCRTPEVE